MSKPPTINRDQYREAYELGVRKLRGQVSITEALADLEAIGVKRASAADLVYNATHLINGDRYTRKLSEAATDDYLKWILRDFGITGLRRAVSALDQHIHYYEALPSQKSPMHAHRRVLESHRALLPPETRTASEPMLNFEWLDRASSGWIDSLPLKWFEKDGVLRRCEHVVQARRSGESVRGRCDVQVDSHTVLLDYEAYPTFNQQQGLYLGVARLHFADTDRTALASLEWRPAGSAKFKAIKFKSAAISIPDEEQYVCPKDEAPRKPTMVRERPGQAKFRTDLKGAYGNTCCMSGCDVPDALEGAHIDAYRSKSSHNLQNGLLLRRDLHRLYDLHLIAVHPTELTIHVHESIRTANGYSDLHGKKIKEAVNPTHRPSPEALCRHWRKFESKHS